MKTNNFEPLIRKAFTPKKIGLLLLITALFSSCREEARTSGNLLYEFDHNQETRWSSPENRSGLKGQGGMENNGAKGHPFDTIGAGGSYVLLDIDGQGIINRMWITISDRSPEMLRSLKIEMYWDNESKPAVSVPFGDFFGVGLGRTIPFENALFANPEGRSFNCFIPMPFKEGAKIVVVNESSKRLEMIFFDVNYSLTSRWNEDHLYFHAFWQRDTATTLAHDFEILPDVKGKGRFLGTNIGVNGHFSYESSWFGEGEVKMYIDGDTDYPTLTGTGTEDYIGTAWGQGKFINQYTGCTIADETLKQWAFYRFHIPDPVYFRESIRTTIQQMGGQFFETVARFQASGLKMVPVTKQSDGVLYPMYSKDSAVILDMDDPVKGWTNYYRSDDLSAVAYFYLDRPSSDLPAIQPVELRTANLRN